LLPYVSRSTITIGLVTIKTTPPFVALPNFRSIIRGVSVMALLAPTGSGD
jgi:hypothetical protein